MLKITIPAQEFFDDRKQEFIYTKETTLQLEHSLVSISKWEAKWKVPFLMERDEQHRLTQEQIQDYIRCMTITQNVDPLTYYSLTNENVSEIIKYIEDKQTATWFGKLGPNKGPRDTRPMTSERLYHLMVNYNIPFSCEKWHISRLMTLIRICQEESKKQEKKNPKDAAIARHNLNAARRAKHGHR